MEGVKASQADLSKIIWIVCLRTIYYVDQKGCCTYVLADQVQHSCLLDYPALTTGARGDSRAHIREELDTRLEVTSV